ncbi:MAG: signal peptidase II [Patescibacteria group bacterium]|nr:signal peptidase II [Patescibacteria group bacterium]
MQKSPDPRTLRLIYAAFLGLGFLLDRALKYLAMRGLPQEELFIIPKILSFTLYENRGMAFGIAVPHLPLVATGAVLLVLLFAMIIYSVKMNRSIWLYASCAIFAGGLSNFIDRALCDATIDYLYLRPYSFINIADIMIVGGCLISIAACPPGLARHGRRALHNGKKLHVQ